VNILFIMYDIRSGGANSISHIPKAHANPSCIVTGIFSSVLKNSTGISTSKSDCNVILNNGFLS